MATTLFLPVQALAVNPTTLTKILNHYTNQYDYVTKLDTNTIQGGSGITVSTNSSGILLTGSGGGSTPGATYYVQVNPPGVQPGNFDISTGTIAETLFFQNFGGGHGLAHFAHMCFDDGPNNNCPSGTAVHGQGFYFNDTDNDNYPLYFEVGSIAAYMANGGFSVNGGNTSLDNGDVTTDGNGNALIGIPNSVAGSLTMQGAEYLKDYTDNYGIGKVCWEEGSGSCGFGGYGAGLYINSDASDQFPTTIKGDQINIVGDGATSLFNNNGFNSDSGFFNSDGQGNVTATSFIGTFAGQGAGSPIISTSSYFGSCQFEQNYTYGTNGFINGLPVWLAGSCGYFLYFDTELPGVEGNGQWVIGGGPPPSSSGIGWVSKSSGTISGDYVSILGGGFPSPAYDAWVEPLGWNVFGDGSANFANEQVIVSSQTGNTTINGTLTVGGVLTSNLSMVLDGGNGSTDGNGNLTMVSFIGNGPLLTGLTARQIKSSTPFGHDAPAGFIGEYFSSITSNQNTVGGSSGTWTNFLSTGITAGDFDFSATVGLPVSTGTFSGFCIDISTISGSFTNDIPGVNRDCSSLPTFGNDTSAVIPRYRINAGNSETIYLKTLLGYSGGIPKIYGKLDGRRVR